jgi:hypothetical protein
MSTLSEAPAQVRRLDPANAAVNLKDMNRRRTTNKIPTHLRAPAPMLEKPKHPLGDGVNDYVLELK